MVCKICKADNVDRCHVWSYQYLDHMQTRHQDHNLSDEDKDAYAITRQEFEKVVTYGVKRSDQAKVLRMSMERLAKAAQALQSTDQIAAFCCKILS